MPKKLCTCIIFWAYFNSTKAPLFHDVWLFSGFAIQISLFFFLDIDIQTNGTFIAVSIEMPSALPI